jgi:RNase P subunit RPR2
MSAKCPNCAEPLLSVKTYSVDIESSGALQSGTVYACPVCSAAITISLGAPPIVAGTILETVTDVSVDPEDMHPSLPQ